MGIRKKGLRVLSAFLFFIFFLGINKTVVHADMGAKPSITLKVVNGPDDYYVALLEKWRDVEGQENSGLKLEEVNDESVQEYLRTFVNDGWTCAVLPFNGEPMLGTDDGFNDFYRANETGEYEYSYSVPDPFRVIVIGADGNVFLSNELDQEEFNSKCTYDVSAGSLTEEIDKYKGIKKAGYVALCLIVTLVSELIVLKLFRYPFSKVNLICFFIINVITNLSLNIWLVKCSSSPMAGFIFLISMCVLEPLIIIIESIFFAGVLKDAEGKRHPIKSLIYGVVANIFSVIVGLIVLCGGDIAAAFDLIYWIMMPLFCVFG